MKTLLLCLTILAGNAAPCHASAKVFHHGKIRVLDPRGAVADWIAVSEGTVVGYGVKQHFESFSQAEPIDLKGRTILPGLHAEAASVLELAGRTCTQKADDACWESAFHRALSLGITAVVSPAPRAAMAPRWEEAALLETLGRLPGLEGPWRVGTLELRQPADFLVVSTNPFTRPVSRLEALKIQEVYVGGERVWGRDPAILLH